jgi:hypothetical protein
VTDFVFFEPAVLCTTVMCLFVLGLEVDGKETNHEIRGDAAGSGPGQQQ